MASAFNIKQNFWTLATARRFAEEEGEADSQAEAVPLVRRSAGIRAKDLLVPPLQISLLLSMPKRGTDKDVLVETVLLRPFVRGTHLVPQLQNAFHAA